VRTIGLLLVSLLAGCTGAGVAEGTVAAEAQALGDEVVLSEATLEIDGVAGEPLSRLELLSATTARLTFALDLESPTLSWIAAALRGEASERELAIEGIDASGSRRRIELSRCLVTGVTWPALAATDKRKRFEVTVELDGEEVKYAQATGSWKGRTNAGVTLSAETPGIDGSFVTKIELPAMTAKVGETGSRRWPTRHYASWELTGLRAELASVAQAEKVLGDGVISESDYQDIIVEMLDQTTRKTARLTVRVKKKSGKPGLALPTIEWTTEEMKLDLHHR
jgi:hypothetical protein